MSGPSKDLETYCSEIEGLSALLDFRELGFLGLRIRGLGIKDFRLDWAKLANDFDWARIAKLSRNALQS